jgi:hypothetical protein
MSTALMDAVAEEELSVAEEELNVAEEELSVAEEELSVRVAEEADLAEFEVEFEDEADREIRACLARPYVTYVP